MLGLFNKKRVRKDAQVAVCTDERAIAVARVRQEKDVPPSLELCDVQTIDNLSLLGSEISRLIKEHHLDRYYCVSMLDLAEYNLLLIEAPDVQPDELRAAIRWRVKDIIDFHIDDAVVDVFEVPNQKTAGRNKMMYAVVAHSDRVKHRIDELTGAGLNLNVIDIPELALRNIAALLPEDVGGVAILYIGRDRGLITITHQATLYLSRRIEIGIDALPDTAMLANDDELIHRWLDSFVIEIQRSLDYYESHFSQSPISSLVITQPGRDIPGITEYLTSQLGVSVRMLDINELIDSQEAVPPVLQSDCLLAIGAALRQEAAAL